MRIASLLASGTELVCALGQGPCWLRVRTNVTIHLGSRPFRLLAEILRPDVVPRAAEGLTYYRWKDSP